MSNPPITVGSHALYMAAYSNLIFRGMNSIKTTPSARNIPKIWPTHFPVRGSKTGRWSSYNWPTVPSGRRLNKRERRKGMKRAQFFIRHQMLLKEEIEGLKQGTMEIRKSHLLDYNNNRMCLLYKNRADELMGKRLLEISDESQWKELSYDIEDPEPKRHFPRV